MRVLFYSCICVLLLTACGPKTVSIGWDDKSAEKAVSEEEIGAGGPTAEQLLKMLKAQGIAIEGVTDVEPDSEAVSDPADDSITARADEAVAELEVAARLADPGPWPEPEPETVTEEEPEEELPPPALSEIQRMINETPDNGTMTIPKGKHIIDHGLIIRNRTGLTLKGSPGTKVLLRELYEDVISVENCTGITIQGINFRHLDPMEEYNCNGGVVSLSQCTDITITQCELNGCGAMGVSLWNCSSISIRSNWIHHNSYMALYLSRSDDVTITKNIIADNAGLISQYGVTNLNMHDNVIRNNGEDNE